MSQENVEIVRHSLEAWNRRDLPMLRALFRFDAELDWSRARGPFNGVYRGHDELEAFWGGFWSTFEDVQLEVYGFMDGGSDVVCSNTAHMRGREGIEVTARSTFAYTLQKGQITSLRMFQERSEALEATGLSE